MTLQKARLYYIRYRFKLQYDVQYDVPYAADPDRYAGVPDPALLAQQIFVM